MSRRVSDWRSLKLGLIGSVATLLAVACGHDWDALDPRLGAASGGASAASTGALGLTSSTEASVGVGGASQTGASTSPATTTNSASTGGMGGGSTAASSVTATSTSSSASSTGTGGGAPAHCGGTGVLTYDFTSPKDPEVYFNLNADSNAGSTVQNGGTAVITLPTSNPQDWFGSFDTVRVYDLTEDRLFIKVTGVPNTAIDAGAFLSLNTGNDGVRIVEQQGSLSFAGTVGGNDFTIGMIPYDPVAHLYWAVHEKGGTTYWETSPDGVTFTAQAQKPTAQLSPVNAVDVQFGAYANAGDANPGKATFDDVNGGGPSSEKWCPSSSFSDDFDDGIENPRWDNGNIDNAAVMTESGGTLNFVLASNNTGFSNYISNVSFDMIDDAIVVQVISGPNPATNAQVYMTAAVDPNLKNYVAIAYDKGKVIFQDTLAGSTNTLGSAALAPWLRIREKAGMTYWETSPDGKTWTAGATLPDVIDMSAVDVWLGAGMYQDEVNPGSAKLDNYNLPP